MRTKTKFKLKNIEPVNMSRMFNIPEIVGKSSYLRNNQSWGIYGFKMRQKIDQNITCKFAIFIIITYNYHIENIIVLFH